MLIYFELVKLIDDVLSSKSVMDYTKISPENLVNRFNEVISSYGLAFDLERV